MESLNPLMVNCVAFDEHLDIKDIKFPSKNPVVKTA